MLWTWYMFFCLPSQLPIFALGILFYFILKDNYRISISPGMILLTASILIAQLTGLTILPQYFLFGIAFVILGIALSKYEFKLLVNPIFIHIGKISFSLYLVHFAVLHWLNKYNLVNYLIVTNKYSCILNYSIRLSLLIVISVIVSTFFYKMIEVPLQNMGKQLINKLNN